MSLALRSGDAVIEILCERMKENERERERERERDREELLFWPARERAHHLVKQIKALSRTFIHYIHAHILLSCFHILTNKHTYT